MRKSRPISRVLSWTVIHLADASPRRSSDLPGSRAGRTWLLSQPASLFGLAPGGVCRAVACCHRRGALLPHHFTLAGARESAWAVYFLLHFPWAHAPQVLPGTVPWEPGLSSTHLRAQRLPGRLRPRTIGDWRVPLKSQSRARSRAAKAALRTSRTPHENSSYSVSARGGPLPERRGTAGVGRRVWESFPRVRLRRMALGVQP